MRAVILAGGKGTRLAPYTTILPKPLLPIGDVPVAEILIRQLAAAGVGEITMAVGHLAGLLQAYFGDGSRWNVAIDYSLEEEPLGTAGPLALVDGLQKTFVVVNGDLLTTLDFAKMVDAHRESGATATTGVFRQKLQIELGVIETDDAGALTSYTEKPTMTYEVSVGAYVMEPEVIEFIPVGRTFDLPDVVKALIAAGRRVQAYRFDGHWLDIGNPHEHSKAADLFERERGLFLPHA
jgi:NDP-sugar pyrophosphorylase family protein